MFFGGSVLSLAVLFCLAVLCCLWASCFVWRFCVAAAVFQGWGLSCSTPVLPPGSQPRAVIVLRAVIATPRRITGCRESAGHSPRAGGGGAGLGSPWRLVGCKISRSNRRDAAGPLIAYNHIPAVDTCAAFSLSLGLPVFLFLSPSLLCSPLWLSPSSLSPPLFSLALSLYIMA